MQTKKFQKRVEDFACEQCGKHVKGNGYTNHCPRCLWGKHVDVNPGDRASKCLGMMKPISVEGSTPNYFLIHECVRCGQKTRIMADKMNSEEALLTVVNAVANSK